jgi:hypothetical protein
MRKEPVRQPISDSGADELEPEPITSPRQETIPVVTRPRVRRSVPANTQDSRVIAVAKPGLADRYFTPTMLSISFVFGAMTGGGAYWLAERAHARQATPSEHLPIVIAQPATPPQPAAKPDVPTAAEPPAAAAVASDEGASEPEVSDPSSSAREARSAAEKALLHSARAQLRSGDAFGAQATLQHMQRRFPRGSLAQERELLSIETLKVLGDREATRRAARAFANAHPNSSHLPALEKLLL